jgi:cyclopropane fatty-acyl-phospholipid synthase-like methyltransferase
MARISDADDMAIADAYDFSGFSRIVDVGGGKGGLLAQILLRAPDATGVLFDQPQVVAETTRLEQAGLSMRAELVGGDFFELIPDGGDCYVIKGVLHDFDDEQCVRILSNCREAMKTGGRVLIANQDLPSPVDGPHPNLTMDIQMMVLLTGRERSVDQWGALFRQAGLRIGETTGTRVAFTLVDGVAEKRG